MILSYYLYSIPKCQLLSFEGDDAFCLSLQQQLAKIQYEEGCNQFGRAVFNSNILTDMETFAVAQAHACPKVKALPSFFRKLQQGDYFYIIDANFPTTNRQIALVWLRAHSMGLDTRKAWNDYLITQGLLKTRFDYYSFGFDQLQTYIGEKDPTQRICRFCHGVTKENPTAPTVSANGYPIIQFGKPTNAHAISDALGNKILFNLEECTTCNGNLSKVENNLIAMMDWRRAMMGIKTKDNSMPNIFGEEASLRTAPDGTQTLYVDETAAKESIVNNILSIRLNNKKTITDQGVYKALCKYVIGLMPASYLTHFRQTIDWICGRITETELPEVQVAYKMPFVSQPILDIYFSKTVETDTPLCTAMLHVCDISYLYILPLADTDGARFKQKGSLTNHWQLFQKSIPAYWQSEDLSNYRPSSPWIDIQVPIDGVKVVLVPHGDKILRQPVSTPKPGAKTKPKPIEHTFPAFDRACVRYKETHVSKFNILHNDEIPTDALHNATVVIDGIRCVINLTDQTADVSTSFTVFDPTGSQSYFDFGFTACFVLQGAERYIDIADDYLALDYNLRDALYYIACIQTEPTFKQKLKGTQYAICSLLKTLCDDERTVLKVYYTLVTDNGIYQFKDTDIHNDPFNI